MSVLAPGRNVVLIGLMGAGKSTVGRLLAARLQRPFVDTDEIVEHETGTAIAELFAAEGERGFRQHESAAVRQVAALRGQVIAVGGGAVLDIANVTHLRSTGDLVLLDAEPATLARRVGDGTTRPLLEGGDAAQRLAQLRNERAAAYDYAAGHVIDTTDRSPEEVADAVLAWAKLQPGLLSRDEAGA
jgi:shikimate kinase